MKFPKWLDTFLTEKGIDMTDQLFEVVDGIGDTHIVEGAVLQEAMLAAPAHEQDGIKSMLVKIDFLNGDVLDYFRHLARGLAENWRDA